MVYFFALVLASLLLDVILLLFNECRTYRVSNFDIVF